MAEVTGTIERIRFYNAHSGYVILKVLCNEEDALVVVGQSPMKLYVGQTIRISGKYETHQQFGDQFVADAPIHASLPQSEEGLKKWMASGFVKGIGKAWALKLVDHFGAKLLDILSETPERLHELKGLGKKRHDILLDSLRDHKASIEVASYMASLGLGPMRTQSLLKKYGLGVVDVIREKPYQLYRDNRGIGFLLADGIAQKNGLPHDSSERLSAAIEYALEEASGSGHCYIPLDILSPRLSTLLGYEVNAEVLREVAGQNIAVDVTADRFSLKNILRAEQGTAVNLLRLTSSKIVPARVAVHLDALDRLLKETQVELTQEQIQAIQLALSHRVVVITGGPGVGKTTVTRALLRTFEMVGKKVLLAAPTGRAAKRLKESTGRQAQTIHRLLKYDPASSSFAYDQDKPLAVDALILDEVSMIDIVLMSQVVEALPSGCFFIMVGDRDQLPSVGAGSVLADVIHSGRIPVAELTQIFRQARFSKIIQTAHNIRLGHMPSVDPESDCNWYRCNDTSEMLATLKDVLTGPLLSAWDKVKDIQVLTSMHRGQVGTKNLNVFLKSMLNASDRSMSAGDKVIQLRNNYDKEVFNGDLGIVVSISDEGVVVKMDTGKCVDYSIDELQELQLAYATTIHKSQGSEYPVVIIMMATEQYMLLNRHLIYTAVTRARKRLILIASPKAVALAVKNEDPGLRRTQLLSWLKDG